MSIEKHDLIFLERASVGLFALKPRSDAGGEGRNCRFYFYLPTSYLHQAFFLL